MLASVGSREFVPDALGSRELVLAHEQTPGSLHLLLVHCTPGNELKK